MWGLVLAEWILVDLFFCDVGRRDLANWRPGGKSCSLMPVPLGSPAETPCLIYLCIYPLPPVPTQDLTKGSTWNEGEKERRRREREVGRGRERGRERVTYAQWELTKHLVIKSKLTFW